MRLSVSVARSSSRMSKPCNGEAVRGAFRPSPCRPRRFSAVLWMSFAFRPGSSRGRPQIVADTFRRQHAAVADHGHVVGAALCRTMVSLVQQSDPGLAKWIDPNYVFPNLMTGCITPATAAAARFGFMWIEAGRTLLLREMWISNLSAGASSNRGSIASRTPTCSKPDHQSARATARPSELRIPATVSRSWSWSPTNRRMMWSVLADAQASSCCATSSEGPA